MSSINSISNSYSSSYKVLTFEQFTKLDKLMNSDIEIHGQGNFPNIKVALKDFVVSFKTRLQNENIPLDSVRLNGGAASHVIGMRQMIDDIGYNDLDLIFGLTSDNEHVFEKVRQLLYCTLRELLSCDENSGDNLKLADSAIDDGYVQKMVKVCNNNDCWSLISLYNNDGENVEVKFVHRMKRPYEFSVDSFQIELDSFLSYYELNDKENVKFSKDFYPTVMAESKYGKFDEALFHLNNKLVATLKPEEIRGGGLLKYCNLLLNGYNIADSDIKNLERYMCSRFFIDFPDSASQQNKLQNYMRTHLRKAPRSKRVNPNTTKTTNNSSEVSNDANGVENKENARVLPLAKEKCDDGSVEQHRVNFLLICRKIIDDSTVCLMNIERACTLNLLDSLIADLLRTYISKNEVKFALDPTESGYFSENSSIANSVTSPNHFSRSSSPGVSMNGVSSASRSSSPATAVYGITPTRLTAMDLAALSGTFLHPASASSGLHFNAPQLFHTFASNIHGFSLINSSMMPQRAMVDQSVLTVSNQHGNQCHTGAQYQPNYQYHHNSGGHHSNHGKNHHSGTASRGNKGGYYNNKQAMSNSIQNYHHHGNHHGYYQHNPNNGSQMSGSGAHHHYMSGGSHHYHLNTTGGAGQTHGGNSNNPNGGGGGYYNHHHQTSQHYNNGAYNHANRNNNNQHHNNYYHNGHYGNSHYNQHYHYDTINANNTINSSSQPHYLNSTHNHTMMVSSTPGVEISTDQGNIDEFKGILSNNSKPTASNTHGGKGLSSPGFNDEELLDEVAILDRQNCNFNSSSQIEFSQCQYEDDQSENLADQTDESSSPTTTCQVSSNTCYDQSTPVVLTAY